MARPANRPRGADQADRADRSDRPRGPLARETVVDAAFDVLTRDGFDGLTVRSIAECLGVQNPALYWHFKNKQEIIDSMAERLVSRSLVDAGPGEPWRDYLYRSAHMFRATICSYRDGARVVASADLSSTALTATLDKAIHLMTTSGMGAKDAFFGAVAVFDFMLGSTFESQSDPRTSTSPVGRPGAAPGTFPSLEAAVAEAKASGLDENATFDAGLTLLLDGLALRVAKSRR